MAEFVGEASGYGNLIDIKHPDGSLTRYAHMDSFNITQGQQVKQGTVIAIEGNTGVGTGPHLHFEIRPNGNPFGSAGSAVDPIPLLPGPPPALDDLVDR